MEKINIGTIGVIGNGNSILSTVTKVMREATIEEVQSVETYIESISKPTGINFYDSLEIVKSKK